MPTPYKKNGPPSTRVKATIAARANKLLSGIQGGVQSDGSILNLKGWLYISSVTTEHDIIIYAIPTTEPSACRKCGAAKSFLKHWGYTELRFYHDLEVHAKRVRVYYVVQRYRCKHIDNDRRKCNATTQQPLLGIDEEKNCSIRLIEYIKKKFFEHDRNSLSLADELGVPYSTLSSIAIECAEQRQKTRVIETPKWLAIDEVNLRMKVFKHEYVVFTDPILRCFIDLLPNGKQETVIEALLKIPNRHEIEVVSMDFDNTLYGGARQALPNADIVIDRRHAEALVVCALKEFLKELHKQKGPHWWKEYMYDPTILFKRFYKLNEAPVESTEVSEVDFLMNWLNRVPELSAAYWLKEDFCNLYELSTLQEVDERYNEWEARAKDVSPAFSSVIYTVRRWRPWIFNYVKYKDCFPINVTNGFAESANNRIKRLRRICTGIGFWPLRAKLLFGEGPIHHRPPHPLDSKKIHAPNHNQLSKSKKIKRKRKQPGPKAASERLRRAYEENDKTRGLLTSPWQHAGYAARFSNTRQIKALPGDDRHDASVMTPHASSTDSLGVRPLRQFDFSPVAPVDGNQLTLFPVGGINS